MKYDHTANSYYLIHTFPFKSLGECAFLNLGVWKGYKNCNPGQNYVGHSRRISYFIRFSNRKKKRLYVQFLTMSQAKRGFSMLRISIHYKPHGQE